MISNGAGLSGGVGVVEGLASKSVALQIMWVVSE